jgi:hypothetical protein
MKQIATAIFFFFAAASAFAHVGVGDTSGFVHGFVHPISGIDHVRTTRILYGINSLRCWRCRGLKYASQSEASLLRAQRKALSIRRRVGASYDALGGPFPPKPPKMRWATYKRLRAIDAAHRRARAVAQEGEAALNVPPLQWRISGAELACSNCP